MFQVLQKIKLIFFSYMIIVRRGKRSDIFVEGRALGLILIFTNGLYLMA